MLSYQHMYHAGGLADVHKHVLLARALAHLVKDPAPLLFVDTHAGRGRYYLDHPAAEKTGEAEKGIKRLLRERSIDRNEPFLAALQAIRGGNERLYPGSPLLAATMLRPQDRLWLWELHPREHGWLKQAFADDERVTVRQADGLSGLGLMAPPKPPNPQNGLILIDPSYEVKAEYEGLPAFVSRLRLRWPAAAGMVWYPMLPARRHEAMRAAMRAEHSDLAVNEYTWADPDDGRGLFGSGLAHWGLDEAGMSMPCFPAFSVGKGTSA